MSPSTLERDVPSTRGVDVDPRIAARRQSVLSERRRRRGRRLLVVLVLVLVVGGAWFVTRTGAFDVDSLAVEGAVHENADEVVAASGIGVGDQLLDVDAGSAADAVERLPWVDTATVDTGLDGVVTITVTERVPVATLTDADGGVHLLDASGRLLGPAEGDTAGLTSLEGVDAAAPGETVAGVDGALQAIGALGPGARSRITAVVVAPDGSLLMKLDPEGVVVYGPATDLAAKATALTATMGQVDQRGIATIDVRDPGNVVVERTQG